MPTKFAMRELTLDYEDKVQEQVLAYLGTNITHDYLDGSKDMNLDLTMREAEQLFNANEKIREMAQSGELQTFHKKCADLQQSVKTGYIKVMDQLGRILQQISEMEEDVYEDMRNTENLERLRSHGSSSVMDLAALSGDDISLENYAIIRGLAQAKTEGSQVIRVAE